MEEWLWGGAALTWAASLMAIARFIYKLGAKHKALEVTVKRASEDATAALHATKEIAGLLQQMPTKPEIEQLLSLQVSPLKGHIESVDARLTQLNKYLLERRD